MDENKITVKYNTDASDIDVAVDTTTTTIKKNRAVDFILRIYGAELRFIFEFVIVALLMVLTIFSASALLRPKSEETVIAYQLTNEKGDFPFKGWELTPSLEAAIETGNVNLKGITVIEKGGEITFEGGDSDKIAIVEYRTEIEDNDPQIYSNEYFEELKRQGRNVHVVRLIGLTTETENNEGAE